MNFYYFELGTNLCFKFSIRPYLFRCMKGKSNNTKRAGLWVSHLVKGSKKRCFLDAISFTALTCTVQTRPQLSFNKRVNQIYGKIKSNIQLRNFFLHMRQESLDNVKKVGGKGHQKKCDKDRENTVGRFALCIRNPWVLKLKD